MLVEQTAIAFEYPTHSHRRDPFTSHAAAKKVERTGLAQRHAARIVEALRNLGGSGTSREIEKESGINFVAVARRMIDLVKAGVVVDYTKLPRREWPQRNGYTIWRLV
jgi:hypothetical protein